MNHTLRKRYFHQNIIEFSKTIPTKLFLTYYFLGLTKSPPHCNFVRIISKIDLLAYFLSNPILNSNLIWKCKYSKIYIYYSKDLIAILVVNNCSSKICIAGISNFFFKGTSSVPRYHSKPVPEKYKKKWNMFLFSC